MIPRRPCPSHLRRRRWPYYVIITLRIIIVIIRININTKMVYANKNLLVVAGLHIAPPSLDLRRRFVADLLMQLVKVVVVASKEGHEGLHVPVVDGGVVNVVLLVVTVGCFIINNNCHTNQYHNKYVEQ